MDRKQRPSPPVDTQCLPAQEPDAIKKTAAYARQERLIVLPTDTVYGVGCDAFNGGAIRALYRAKQRPRQKAIPILLADVTDLPRVVRAVPDMAHRLIKQFWPGPLTLILPKHPDLPPEISDNEGVAVRIPDSEVARAVIRAAGGALAVTSANRSSEPPARTAAEAMQALGGWVTAVLDDGPAPMGIASTIIDCTGDSLTIVRHGPLPAADLLAVTIASHNEDGSDQNGLKTD